MNPSKLSEKSNSFALDSAMLNTTTACFVPCAHDSMNSSSSIDEYNAQTMSTRQRTIRLPTILFAVLLLLATNYWVSSTWNGFSLNALFINAIFVTFLLSLLNPLLRRIRKQFTLHPSELFLIYMMLAIATGAAGHDTLEMLTQTIGHPFWFGSPENEWPELFFKNLPRWLMVENKSVLEGFYTYGESFYEPKVFYTWLRPLSGLPFLVCFTFAWYVSISSCENSGLSERNLHSR